MSTLPDGIYVRQCHPTKRDELALEFVKDGRGSGYWPVTENALHLPDDTSGWTRVADLPDLRMSEPQQIGYPVMAGCEADAAAHLHIHLPGGHKYAWRCEWSMRWSDLVDPRDLTADEINEHNLWTGGAQR